MPSNPVVERLKQLDAYPKTLDDYRIKTFAGGAVTIISYAIMTLLFLSELQKYLTPEVTEEIFVDTSRTPKLQIALNITMPHIPCSYLSLDAMDSSGDQHLQIDHDVYKIPLDAEGNPIASPLKEDVSATTRKQNDSQVAVVPTCGSCYGAEIPELNITCCNTCGDVRAAYLKRRWMFPDPETIEQCKGGKDETALPKEGCNIYGKMEVNRVGGSFHIAPGKSFSINHVHVHDVQPFSSAIFNTSHTIEHLSFGYNIPGKTDPLDGTKGIATEDGSMFQYYLKIVPLVYSISDKEHLLLTNQFSVTRHQKAEGGHSTQPPGVFFTYELAPLTVKYSEKKRSFGHFATNVCAIIGGVFTVASIIDSVLYRSVQALQHKVEIGKVY